MADNTIDTLNIQIGSSTTQAVRSINNLVKKLDTLNAAIGKLDMSRLNNFSNSLILSRNSAACSNYILLACSSISSVSLEIVD